MSDSFSRLDCRSLESAQLNSKEWLVTNGIGGFGMGTVGGEQTRRYHALLIAALQPPLGRTVMLSAVKEYLLEEHGRVPLDDHLSRFHLEGSIPVWTFLVKGSKLEKRIWMEQGYNRVYVQYEMGRGAAPIRLDLDLCVHHRDFHENTSGETWENRLTLQNEGFSYHAFPGAAVLHVQCTGANPALAGNWLCDIPQRMETYRGLDDAGNHYLAATLSTQVEPDSPTLLTAGTTPRPATRKPLDARRKHDESVQKRAGLVREPAWIRHLAHAADQFIVERPLPESDPGLSVIAGFPWFGDWGRDTMISLPGLLLSTRRFNEAAHILRTFARYVDRGMLPNRFPDDSGPPAYNTVDATLWYFDAIRMYSRASGDIRILDDLFPVLEDVFNWHRSGTRYGIAVDPHDGLLRAGEAGVQLTWMDAKVDDWVVTPRMGKPVEINALWYHALHCMAEITDALGKDPHIYKEMASLVQHSFHRFWNPARGCCFDVIDAPEGTLDHIRPNQLFAVALDHSPLPFHQQRAVVDVCEQHLLTPRGLRSLSPEDEAYKGTYGGDRHQRDGAYHQGTVWGWLIGPFVRAHLRVYNDPGKARSYLTPFAAHLEEDGWGTLSEIFDGDPPHKGRGCPAQAWTVAEVLRTWQATAKTRQGA